MSARHLRPVFAPAATALRALLLLAALLPAVACERAPLAVVPAPITAYHFTRNRCDDSQARSCRDDADCSGRRCVSVLSSTAGAFGRDAGHTIQIGDRVLWLFGDSFTPTGLRSMTAGWSDSTNPLTLRDIVDSRGAPTQFVAFDADEQAYNAGHRKVDACCRDRKTCPAEKPYCKCAANVDCNTRVALWPGDGFATEDGQAMFFYEKHVIGAAEYDFRALGTGLARFAPEDAQAQRLMKDGEPLYLFGPREAQFSRGVRVDEPNGSYFYLFASTHRQGCAVDVLSARVPLAKVSDRAAYEFWNGSNWSGRLEEAEPILKQIPGGLGSVGWDQASKSYLAAWSDVCTGGSKLLLRAARQPQGPWSDARTVDLAGLGARGDAYYGMWHPQFGNSRKLLVSYYQPEAIRGQIRLVVLELP